jgi:acylglycerol lipase
MSSQQTPEQKSKSTSGSTTGEKALLTKTLAGAIVQPKTFPPLPDDWESEVYTFSSSDKKLKLFSILHKKKKIHSPRVLVILHGFGEHIGRYQHFAHYLSDTVDMIYLLDHRGHGRSEGTRGFVERFDQYTEDALLAIQKLQERLSEEYESHETHLLGHSMGGLIALRLMMFYNSVRVSSFTLSAPALQVKMEVPLWKKVLAHSLKRIWGQIQIPAGICSENLSHDPSLIEAHKKDRLVHNKSTPSWFVEFLNAGKEVFESPALLKDPVFVQVPLADRVINSDRTLAFYKKLKGSESKLKTYPELFHEIYNEGNLSPDRTEVFEDLKKWIQEHSLVREAEHE